VPWRVARVSGVCHDPAVSESEDWSEIMKEIIEESVEAASLPSTVGTQEEKQIEKPEMDAAVADGRPSAEEPKITTGMVSVERLQPYEKNAEIYREYDDPPFLENINQELRTETLEGE
jgi:hypothetical protein